MRPRHSERNSGQKRTEVDVGRIKSLQGFLQCFWYVPVSRIVEFGDKEDLLASNSGSFDAISDFSFVAYMKSA